MESREGLLHRFARLITREKERVEKSNDEALVSATFHSLNPPFSFSNPFSPPTYACSKRKKRKEKKEKSKGKGKKNCRSTSETKQQARFVLNLVSGSKLSRLAGIDLHADDTDTIGILLSGTVNSNMQGGRLRLTRGGLLLTTGA